MKKNKKIGFNIDINEDDKQIIKILKETYSINITQLIKNYLREYLNKLKNMEK